LKETVVASDFDFQGPGVFKPHPKKNWVNPDAKQVHWAGDERPRRASGPSRPSGPSGPSKERGGRSPLKLLAGLVGLIILVAIIAALLFAFVID